MEQQTQPLDSAAADPAPRRRSRRGAWTTAVVAVVVLLGGAFAYFNTNVLNSARLCHGWVSPDEAAAALGGGAGRVVASEDSATSCTIRLESWLPGPTTQLNLRAVAEQSGFPFRKGAWEVSGARHVLSGGAHGAYDEYGGWALLPTACKKATDGTGPSPVLRAAVTSRDAAGDAAGMGRLLTGASGALADAADCAAPGDAAGTARDTAPAAVRAADLDKVCGISGFRLPEARGPKGRRITEQVTGTLRQGLYCDLSFDGDEEGPFARLAVVHDAALVATLDHRDFTRARCDGKNTVLAHDLRYLDDSARAATRLPDTADFTRTFDEAARTAMSCA
ncbi:hypothetical protein [Streptomyces sp. NPDC049813]|uniref:hypothetical protein n=1 Tax=Streptomyces sp. NPDC049813 TaxID=3365597 RepID=UPI0037A19ACE